MEPQDPNQQNQPYYQRRPGESLPPVPPPFQPSEQPGQQNAQEPQQQQSDQPQQMYYSRPLEPQRPVISPAIQQKCEESRKKYPHLNLSDGEYIIEDVKRHPIGLLSIWGGVAAVVLAILVILALLVVTFRSSSSFTIPTTPLALMAILLASLAVIGGYIGAYVYKANRFYLTNESVIQNIQMSLFSNREQTVSLGNIEDASYAKHGVIEAMLDYGTIRLSTQGDETTYRFPFAAHPAQQVAKLNNAVESFKNGRPIH
jgi:hypothetical protein